MRNLKRLSKKAASFCNMSGYDVDAIRANMGSGIELQVCETVTEMDENEVDYSYPYVLFNPFNITIKGEIINAMRNNL